MAEAMRLCECGHAHGEHTQTSVGNLCHATVPDGAGFVTVCPCFDFTDVEQDDVVPAVAQPGTSYTVASAEDVDRSRDDGVSSDVLALRRRQGWKKARAVPQEKNDNE